MNLILRFLRFCNLLEPGKNIISISKTWMWSMVILTFMVIWNDPGNFAAIVAAVSAQMLAVGNYAYRRYDQGKRSTVEDKDGRTYEVTSG